MAISVARIYFDNAATSWPKPETVYRAVDHAMRGLGVSIGRGQYQQSIEVRRLVEEVREDIAELIQAPSRQNIAFTFSCTDAISTAIAGLLQPGDHVVTSVVEHNSILRPLKHLELSHSVSVTLVGCDEQGRIIPDEVIAALRPETKLVALSHASNVTGATQTLSAVGKACQLAGVPFLVDAAQTIGTFPVDVRKLGCNLLAASGHKGLLGPLGTGFLYYSREMGERITPLRFGGTGHSGPELELPRQFPEKFEAGSLNLPGLLGLSAGLKFIGSKQGKELGAMSRRLGESLFRNLDQLSGVKLFGPRHFEQRLSVFALQIANFESHDAAAILDTRWSIQSRAGLHCAPLLHQALKTESSAGLVRISPGLFNTEAEFEILIDALAAMVHQTS
jgi:cysteine desulfurase / selenocysteine lyase